MRETVVHEFTEMGQSLLSTVRSLDRVGASTDNSLIRIAIGHVSFRMVPCDMRYVLCTL